MGPDFFFSNLIQKSYKQPSYQTAYYQGRNNNFNHPGKFNQNTSRYGVSRALTYAEYQNPNNAGVNRAVTYTEYQNHNAGYQYGSSGSFPPAVNTLCVTVASFGNQGYYGPQNKGNYQENVDFSIDCDVEDATQKPAYPRSVVQVVPYRTKSTSNSRYPRYPQPSRNGSRWDSQQLVRYPAGTFQNNSRYGYTHQYNRYGGYSSSQNRGSHRGNFNSYPGTRSITCFTCGEHFSNKTTLFAHRSEAHSTRNYYCPVCNKEFGLLKLMKDHEKTHTIQACPECPEVFKFKESLVAHKEHAHQQLPVAQEPAKTDAANKSGFKNFASPTATSTPAASFSESTQDSGIHIKSERHACPHCIKSFDSEDKLKSHSRVHTEPQPESTTVPQSSDKLSCSFCIKKFSTRRELALHQESAHTTTYYCHKCPAEFSTESERSSHESSHI